METFIGIMKGWSCDFEKNIFKLKNDDIVEETRDEIDKDEVILDVDVDVNVSLDVDVSPIFFPKVEENKSWEIFVVYWLKYWRVWLV